MIELYRTAAEIQEFFRQRDWRYCIIGGVAVLRWGQIRATKDVGLKLIRHHGQPFTRIKPTRSPKGKS